MRDQLGTRDTRVGQGCGEGVGVGFQGVVEVRRPVTDAVSEHVDQQRSASGEQRMNGNLREVGR